MSIPWFNKPFAKFKLNLSISPIYLKIWIFSLHIDKLSFWPELSNISIWVFLPKLNDLSLISLSFFLISIFNIIKFSSFGKL